MATPAEKVKAVLMINKPLRSALNVALDNIFIAAGLSQLTLQDKQSIWDMMKTLLVVDQQYTNIHVHWS
jgi:hypothetical protein